MPCSTSPTATERHRCGEPVEAVKLYTQTAEKGHTTRVQPRQLLQVRHRCGEEPVRGCQAVHQTAEKGHAAAMANLGYCYEFGNGVEKNLSEAVKLYTQAAEKGHATAMSNLGLCYKRGKCGLSVDLTAARRYYQMAADKGHARAANALARLDGNNAP